MSNKNKRRMRTATGQPSRSAASKANDATIRFEEGPTQTVLQARRKMRKEFSEPDDAQKWRKSVAKPVTKDEVRNHKLDARGSILGSMWADGKITADERRAGEDYCERYTTYASLAGLPRPTPQGPAYGEVRGGNRPERIGATIAARKAHDADQHILRHCGSGVMVAIKRACVRDEAAPIHQVKEGLSALANAGR